ncbi:MAG: polysulfide reductase NrfD [Gammaproteobacteria bacterium]|nr:polysulfide reductase NrfD [Gammaproteobacteria bacterium]MDD9874543.1 polysulfide reductase NrfD [Gammaproteobacteria bacterium]
MPAHFHQLKITAPEYRAALAVLLALAALGYAAAHYMDAGGHHITGMNNRVVWGIPHVFALALILAASGALNVASLSSVFGLDEYQPLAGLSALLAIVLLVGGLLVLVLDLGRPDRLIVALTHYNFKSVFAWNILLYTGFIALAVGYLYVLVEPGARRAGRVRAAGMLSLLWRLVLTSGSGAIFGFVVARPMYHAAVMAPLFIALSLALGGAAFQLVAAALARWHGDYLDESVLARQARLLAWFVAAVLLLTAIFHLTHGYAAERRAVERFILMRGGVYTALFWAQAGLGGALPLALLLAPAPGVRRLCAAAALVVLGGFAHLYVIIIGGQAFPLPIFPGKTVTGGFYDGEVAAYAPSLPEFLLGLGGVAAALLLLLAALRVLPFMPPPRRARQRG